MHTKNTLGFLLFCCLFLMQATSFAQKQYNPWQDKAETTFKRSNAERQIIPAQYRSLQLDMTELQTALKQAPPRFSEFAKQNPIHLSLPMPDGTMQAFSITDAPVLHPDLAARYPGIHSYAGKGIDDPSATIRFDVTPAGFHAMVLSAVSGSVFIDPYAKGDTEHYIAYYKKDYVNHLGKAFTCHVDDSDYKYEELLNNDAKSAGDCQLRNFSLALACTGEYAQFHGGTVNSVLAAMNTTMTRVNGLFERDASITMTIIANNDELIFLNAGSDPYTNNSGGAMLNQNQQTIDAAIGANNYDIGHVFSTGGGGVAQLQSPCGSGRARGVTGLGNPVGDPFDVDYVAHEMGHQYGATHTFNNSCGGNRTGSTAYEPGSGATILGYAGICPPNIQNNSDAYFHTASILQMTDFVVNTNCPDVMNTNNDPPVVLNVGNYIIPHSTPFELIADATDPNGDMLTYCWEQIDNEIANMPPEATSTGGPLFRSFDPTTLPNRVFPRINDLVNNTTYQWEVLPGVARDMNFQCTVRDNNSMNGCTAEDNMNITVDGNSGPFLVTAPNTNNITWLVGTQETITWDVANTDQAPVNASTVDISLSFDGGYTYPSVLATGIPNNGSYTIMVPNTIGTENRVRVQGSGNIFFDISNRNFAIEVPPSPTFILSATPSSQSLCGTDGTTSYELNLESLVGFDETVSLSVDGLPAGASASFSQNTIIPTGIVTMTLNGLDNVATGTYDLTITGNAASVNIMTMVDLTVFDGAPSMTNLSTPVNNATGIDIITTFDWEANPAAAEYVFEIATNPMFGDSTIFSGTVTEATLEAILSTESVYYWQVTAVNICGEGTPSGVFSFQTAGVECTDYTGTGLPLPLMDNGNTGYNLNVPDNNTIVDASVNIKINHTWVGDLSASLTSPSGAMVNLFTRPGFPDFNGQWGCEGDNLDLTISDFADNTPADLAGACGGGNPSIQGAVQPLTPFSTVSGQASNGNWVFEFNDFVQEDAGSLTELTLTICYSEQITLATNLNQSPLTVQANLSETVSNTYLNTTSMGIAANEIIYTLTSTPTSGTLLLNGMPISLGTYFTQADIDNGNLTYQHNGNNATNDSFNFDVIDANNGWIPNNTFNINILNNTLAANTTLDNDIDCNNNNNGQITVSTSGGTMPYEYSLDGMNYQMSPTFSSLMAGTYSITIRDANSFTFVTNSVSVTNPTALGASSTVDEAAITVTASGGTGTLMYSIDGGANYQASNIFTGLNNGDYTITIQDANACTTTTMATVSVNTLVVSASTDNDVSCNGASDGTLIVTVSGGAMPFQYSIDGGTSFQMSNVFTELAAGNYEVLIQDTDGFTQTTNSVTINEPSVVTASSSVTGDAITVTASGGTGDLMYSIDGSTFQASNIFTGLENGSYTITVQDANGCITTSNAIVAVNSLVVSATISNDITCNNANNGSIEVNVGGGDAPYMYSLNGGMAQTSNVFNNLEAGTYTVDVVDANGFEMTTNMVTITDPQVLNLSANVNENEITATANGGTGALTYSLNNGTPQSSNVFSGLGNGIYTIVVQDANGCIETTTATVAVNTLAVSASLGNDISCNNVDDGSIMATVAGGTAPFEYSLNGVNFQPDNTFTNLSAGDYTVTVRDAEGFTMETNSVTITNPTLLIVSASVNEDQVSANANGGTGTIWYSINGGTLQANNTFDGLANGSYTVTAQDENGCTATTTATVSVNTLAVSASLSNDISCNNANDGTISVTVNSGTPPYMYSLDGMAFQMNNSFGNLAAGAYSIIVRDSEGFTVTTNMVTITNPTLLSLSANVNETEITANGAGGTGDLMYSIDGGMAQANNVFTGLTNGTYEIVVQDANGCTASTTATVSVNTLAVSANVSNGVSCNGANDASIEVTTSGGMAPFEYSLDGMTFQMSNTFDNLAAGDYIATVRDADGFTMTTNTLTITNPALLSLSANVNENEITAMASGGTGDLMYSINGGTFQTNNVFSNLGNGDYEITVQDANGCFESTTVSIDVLEPFVILTSITTNITCNNGNDGTITIDARGGIEPYMYSINGGEFQSSNIFSNLTEGSYEVTLMDANNSIINTTVTINNPDAIAFTVGITDNNITVSSVSGGTGAYEYSIDGGVTTQASPDFMDLENGTYTVGVLDENGCSTFEQVIINNTSTHNLGTLDFELYPNPSTGLFSIRFAQNTIVQTIDIQLFDILGRRIHSEQRTGNQHQIDVRHLAAGTYQIRLQIGDDFGTKSIVLVR